jgi:hypothetical protein
MPRKTVLVDDLDGSELPEDTQPVVLSLGRTTYTLFLSEKSHDKLLKALEPYLKDAETTSATPALSSPQRPRQSPVADKERMKAIRAWAQEAGIKYKDKPLGDRGRIPQEIIEAYDKAN